MTDSKKLLIVISLDTKSRLANLKHPGQTWDGIITEILDKVEPKKLEDVPPISTAKRQIEGTQLL